MGTIFGREPVLILAAIQAAIALVAAFGLQLTGEQIATLVAFTAAALGVVARQRVTPV